MRTWPDTKERNALMRKLVVEHGWTLQAVGDKYGITRERVRQIVGNVGKDRRFYSLVSQKLEKILKMWEEGYLFTEISQETGVPYYYIQRLKLPRNYKPIPHGSPHAYTSYKCRCDVCRKANSERIRQRNHQLRARGLCIKCQVKSETWICYECGVRLRARKRELREARA